MKPEPTPAEAGLAEHVERSVQAVAEFHLEHYRSASWLQRGMDGVTDVLGRPVFAVVMALAVATWIWLSLRAGLGAAQTPLDWLELAAAVSALLISILILVTQRREDLLAARRAQLTLELAVLADEKSAKIIALLEELRRDHPDVADRVDPESDEMASPADPGALVAAIDERAN